MTVAEVNDSAAGQRRAGGVLAFVRLHKLASFAIFAALLIVLVAILAPIVAPFSPDDQKLLMRLRPPIGFPRANDSYLLGTDQLGRDVLSRCIFGLRLTLAMAFFGTVFSILLGCTLGLIAGLGRGLLDDFLMAVVDVMLSLPFILVALLLIAIAGSNLIVLVIVLGLANWAHFARLTRALVLSMRDLPYVEAARAAGAGPLRIAVRHMVPNMVSPIVVMATISFSGLILLESSLSFLGLVVQPPTATLGSMVGQSRDYLVSAPWAVLAPALFIVVVSLVAMIIGDFLRDYFDVRLRER